MQQPQTSHSSFWAKYLHFNRKTCHKCFRNDNAFFLGGGRCSYLGFGLITKGTMGSRFILLHCHTSCGHSFANKCCPGRTNLAIEHHQPTNDHHHHSRRHHHHSQQPTLKNIKNSTEVSCSTAYFLEGGQRSLGKKNNTRNLFAYEIGFFAKRNILLVVNRKTINHY